MKSRKLKALFLILLGSIKLSAQVAYGSFQPINDSTKSRYRYDVEERSWALIDQGSSFESIDLSEKDRLKPQQERFRVSEGINAQNEVFIQVETLESDPSEAWLSTPDLRFISPRASYGFDSSGGLEYRFFHSALELLDAQDEHQAISDFGFRPVLTFFPNKHSAFVQEYINDGFHFSALAQNAFRLSKGNVSMEYDPTLKRILNTYVVDSCRYRVETQYTLLAPYGYVPTWEKEEQLRLDLDDPVTFLVQRVYSNHVIEDLPSRVEKYTDLSHIAIYPNPVDQQYEVVLVGIPNAQVSMVQIRDHFGNIVASQHNPTVEGNIITLNAQGYPSGILILILTSQHGIYSTTLTKI